MKLRNLYFASLIVYLFCSHISISYSQQPEIPDRWVASWATSQRAPSIDSEDTSLVFENITIRQIIHTSIGGDKIRLKFANYSNESGLKIEKVSIAVIDNKARTLPKSNHDVTFSGIHEMVIPAGAAIYSDPVDLNLAPFTNIAVSMYFSDSIAPATYHRQGLQTSYISTPGNFVNETDFPIAEEMQRVYFLNGLEVDTNDSTKLIAAFGDSITDGTKSSTDLNKRWPNILAQRLEGKFGVINQGIAGNRLLNDFVGKSGIERFKRDVLSWPNLSHVIVLLGINDIGYSRYPSDVFEMGIDNSEKSADELISGYRNLISAAHEMNVKIIGATLLPFKYSGHYSETGETTRQSVNDWIRESGEFDEVIDFDAVLRDPNDLSRIVEEFQEDWLHPNDAGYETMANAIKFEVFD